MVIYANALTGITDEVDGDSFLINTDVLSTEDAEHAESLSADELVTWIEEFHPDALTEIPR